VFYSPSAHVGFAHYTKTAGTSLQHWFRRILPDGELLERENPHLPVAVALDRVMMVRRPSGWRRLFARRRATAPRPPLIVGVIRDPFEMLVSLYEYWRRHAFPVEPEAAFILAARHGPFPEFLRMAVVDGHAPTYEWFFDVGGRAWSRTRLLDFATIDVGLRLVARELGIDDPPLLERRNAATAGRRDLDAYRLAAGDLLAEVRRHFRWYYDEGLAAAVGAGRASRAA
jgi:hypothetical protein